MSKSPYALKILSGVCKGLSLRIPPKEITRPTKAIVRTSLFNVLRPQIASRVFIEVFGGSGSVGLEALSCGACEALFFEKDPLVFEVLQTNIDTYQRRDSARARAIQGDGLILLQNYLIGLSMPYILYFDPPFGGLLEASLQCLECLDVLKDTLAIFEHASSIPMPRNLASFSIIKQTRFGRTSLSYYSKS
ncbi:16S rRNA (guanine(966)-N(2))-methyltransferase RsmD [Helicobacter salomonis]|uniref:16S rRNA (guanine(966)-N(2))-methyltransferase RsmD n=1 Tax=Helicobacter salomonis TaxID=56878 RepID=UPI000CF08E15|nr:16S rRNA (guanine(966)-N(2))-methyltransferase RsmD [Helicobacter salomonis]